MPGKYLSLEKRTLILNLHVKEQKSYAEIAKLLSRRCSTIQSVIGRFRYEGRVKNKPKSGRPAILTDADRLQIKRMIAKDPFIHPFIQVHQKLVQSSLNLIEKKFIQKQYEKPRLLPDLGIVHLVGSQWTNMNAREHNLKHIWQRIITILTERTIAFQKIMLYNRRQTAKRIRKRQRLLRMQYVSRLVAVQNQFLLKMPRPVQKRIWREERHSDFWDVRVEFFSDDEWLEMFRMSRKTFRSLCERVKDDMTPKCSSMNKPIPLEKRVAMAIYKLVSGSEYRVVSQMFGVARSTVCRFLRMLCEALTNKHMDSLIRMPERDEQLEIIHKFENISNLPLVLGAVGVTHIPINPPLDGFENYINAGGWPSIILQGVVDHNFVFRKIELNARDPAIYVESRDDLPDITRTIDEKKIRGYLVGSTPYPSLTHILTKYPNPKDDSQEFLNACIEEVTSIGEDAFCRLFARWRVISKKTDIEYRNMANVIGACVVLHNLIEMNGDKFNYEWIAQMKPSYKDLQPENDAQTVFVDTEGGNVLREFLSNFLKTCCN